MTDDSDPFAGLDDIRWGRMRHAYGPATELPELLRGLADPDPAVREVALDGMYGAVHHQGDVYTCTVAAIPFLLRVAGHPGLPGRAEVVRLLASIGSAENPAELTGRYRQANQAVSAAYPLWAALLDDADPQMRAAVTAVLPACADQAQAVVTRLFERLPRENDATIRAAIVQAAAELARRDERIGQVREWLAAVVATEPDPQLRLVALSGLTSLPGDPADRPVVEVRKVLSLFAALYQTGTPTTPPKGFETDTLVGSLRLLHEQADENRRAPQAAELVRNMSASYGDRVDNRVRLLTALLRSPDWECRLDALIPAGNLIDEWRGDYHELITLVAEQIRDGHPGLRPRAVHVVENLGALAAPAADALAALLATAEREAHHSAIDERMPWVVEWSGDLPTVGPALHALSCAGDPRALPMLAWALDRERMPRDVGHLVARFGPQAASLLPILRRRLSDLPTGESHNDRRDALANVLAKIGPAAAAALPELLDLPVTPAVLEALTAIGPASDEVLPILREAAASQDPQISTAAAKALWHAAGDADGALAVADRHLNGAEYALRDAADILAELGPAAQSRAGQLRRLTRRKDRYGWLPLSAARALWRVTRDPAPVLPVLKRTWNLNPHTRRVVASVWTEMGPAAASAHAMLTTELSQVRRHNVVDDGYSTGQVPDDEDLLILCRTALATLV